MWFNVPLFSLTVDWRVRPLVLFTKRWARFHDINNAAKKTISSYSFCLMMINYLQGLGDLLYSNFQTLLPIATLTFLPLTFTQTFDFQPSILYLFDLWPCNLLTFLLLTLLSLTFRQLISVTFWPVNIWIMLDSLCGCGGDITQPIFDLKLNLLQPQTS